MAIRWMSGGLAGRLDASGKLKGGCRILRRRPKSYWRPGVVVCALVLGCLQRTAAAGIAWQSSVRRGTASKDGACGTNVMGQLGLQQTTAGRSALLGDSSVVHHRKMAQAITWLASMAAEAIAWVAQRDAVVRRARFDCLMGIFKHGATPFIALMATLGTDPRHEYCGGRGEAPACGVFCMETRARRSAGGCGEAPRVVSSR